MPVRHRQHRPQFLVIHLCSHCQQESGCTELEAPRCFCCGESNGLIEVRREPLTPEAIARRMTGAVDSMMENLQKAWECEPRGPRDTAEETMLLQALAKGSDLQKGIDKMTKEMQAREQGAGEQRKTVQVPQVPKSLEEYLAAVKGDPRTFTQVLRAFERQHGLYQSLSLPDAERIFTHCKRVFGRTKVSSTRYNALRLAKFTVTTPLFTRRNVQRIWELYSRAIADTDGNVRHAGSRLLERYLFGMLLILDPYPRRRRIREEGERHRLESFLLTQLRELLEREAAYLAAHPDINEEEELYRAYHRWPCSWETRDKRLRTIRRGVEEFCRGTWIPDLLRKHGDDRTLRSLEERSLIW